jgi:hypothetical protein
VLVVMAVIAVAALRLVGHVALIGTKNKIHSSTMGNLGRKT